MKLFKLLTLGLAFGIITTACNKDEEDTDNNDSTTSTTEENTCSNATFASSVANGSFGGNAFSVEDGFAQEDPFDSTAYRIRLFNEEITGDKCDPFNFDLPAKSLIFTLPKATGTYNLGISTGYSVSFNLIEDNSSSVEAALCGKIEISSITDTKISGKIIADTQTGNDEVNGTFEIDLCNE